MLINLTHIRQLSCPPSPSVKPCHFSLYRSCYMSPRSFTTSVLVIEEGLKLIPPPPQRTHMVEGKGRLLRRMNKERGGETHHLQVCPG